MHENSRPEIQFEAERNDALESIKGSILSVEDSGELAGKVEDEIDWSAENTLLNYHIRIAKKRRREKWDTVLRWLVVIGFISSQTIIILIGFNIMHFDNALAVPSVVAAGVLGTYTLAKLAIKYFFNDDDMKNSDRS